MKMKAEISHIRRENDTIYLSIIVHEELNAMDFKIQQLIKWLDAELSDSEEPIKGLK